MILSISIAFSYVSIRNPSGPPGIKILSIIIFFFKGNSFKYFFNPCVKSWNVISGSASGFSGSIFVFFTFSVNSLKSNNSKLYLSFKCLAITVLPY